MMERKNTIVLLIRIISVILVLFLLAVAQNFYKSKLHLPGMMRNAQESNTPVPK